MTQHLFDKVTSLANSPPPVRSHWTLAERFVVAHGQQLRSAGPQQKLVAVGDNGQRGSPLPFLMGFIDALEAEELRGIELRIREGLEGAAELGLPPNVDGSLRRKADATRFWSSRARSRAFIRATLELVRLSGFVASADEGAPEEVFFGNHLAFVTNAKASKGEIYTGYKEWASSFGLKATSYKAFRTRLLHWAGLRGFSVAETRTSTMRLWIGLCLAHADGSGGKRRSAVASLSTVDGMVES